MRRLAFILALLPALAIAQTPLTTADDWQAAVQTAAPSSWFAFAAGTYTTTGTALTVTSGWTRIQGAGPGQSYLTSGHATNWGVVQLTGPEIVLEGFTVYGGSTSNYGGGVQGTGGQTVSNCVIVSNLASVGGGTYYVNVHDSVVAKNYAFGQLTEGAAGGGVFLAASNAAVRTTISNNFAVHVGGGATGPHPTQTAVVDDCDIVDNSARDAGGVYRLTATNSRILRNYATNASSTVGGGGACFSLVFNSSVISNVATKAGGGGYSVVAADSTFAHNSATSGGGGNSLYGTNMTVRDNVATAGGGLYGGLAASSVIERNVANLYGGGGAHATLLYSLIVSNRVNGSIGGGGGIHSSTADSCVFVDNYDTPSFGEDSFNSTVRNCTILNTNAAAPIVQDSSGANKSRVIANTLVVHASQTNIADYAGAAWTNVAANYFTNSATGLFLPDDPPYRLPPDSPLIDQGNPTYATTPYDLYLRDRTQGTVDVGAVEYQLGIDEYPAAAEGGKLRWILNMMGGSR